MKSRTCLSLGFFAILLCVCLLSVGVNASVSPPLAIPSGHYMGIGNDWYNYTFSLGEDMDDFTLFRSSIFWLYEGALPIRAMEDGNEDLLIYRFIFLPSFYNIRSLRVEIDVNKNTGVLVYKRCAGASRGGPLKEVTIRPLTQDECENYIREMAPFWDIEPQQNNAGLDGSDWILESVKEGQYKGIMIWCGGEIRELCGEMMELAGISDWSDGY